MFKRLEIMAGPRYPPLHFGTSRFAPRCRSGPHAAFRRHEGRDGRGRSDEGNHPMTTEHDDTGFEPPHTSSPTDHVLAELQLYGYPPFQDEPAPRPLLPEPQAVADAGAPTFGPPVRTLRHPPPQPRLHTFPPPPATPT